MGMLDGRVAIVTGAGRGLGRAHALELAAAGAAVVVNDYGASLGGDQEGSSPADSVVAEIEAAGGRAVADHGSVSDWSAAETMVQRAIDAFGRLDAVVNNAGITRDRMLTSSAEEDFDATFAVHLKGTVAVSHHAARYWRDRSKEGAEVSGRIINTTSGAGLFGNIGQTAYSAAKAGIIGFTQTAALELRRYGVTVNAISPVALTRMTEKIWKPGAEGEFDPLDAANASGPVVYLAGRESGWITGQVLRIEGNRLVQMRGWTVAGEYTSRSGGALTPAELCDGLPLLYSTMPPGLGNSVRR